MKDTLKSNRQRILERDREGGKGKMTELRLSRLQGEFRDLQKIFRLILSLIKVFYLRKRATDFTKLRLLGRL